MTQHSMYDESFWLRLGWLLKSFWQHSILYLILAPFVYFLLFFWCWACVQVFGRR